MEDEVARVVRLGLKDIVKELQGFKTELKAEFTAFKEEVKQEMKEELENFKGDVYRKLSETAKEVTTHSARIDGAEQRIAEVESWNMEAKEALLLSLKQQRILQDKLTDQEGRNRRNNLRIFGLKEGEEGGGPATQFIETFLKAELSLPPDINLQVQRAHRALASKPPADKPPRSIVVNFLQYTVKEAVLKAAWGKKVEYQGRALFFDHDYATEIVQKRKEYIGIKRALKEKGIRFQTPLSKIRIHWQSGPQTYETAREAAADLHNKGIAVEKQRGDAPRARRGDTLEGTTAGAEIEERLQQASPWQRTQHTRETAARVRDRLQEFQRKWD